MSDVVLYRKDIDAMVETANDKQIGVNCPLCGLKFWQFVYDGSEYERKTGLMCRACGFVARIYDKTIPDWSVRYKTAKGIKEPKKESVDPVVKVVTEVGKVAENRDEQSSNEPPKEGRAKKVFRRFFNF